MNRTMLTELLDGDLIAGLIARCRLRDAADAEEIYHRN